MGTQFSGSDLLPTRWSKSELADWRPSDQRDRRALGQGRRYRATTYIILSRFSPEAFDDPEKFKELASEVSAKIKKQFPDVTWKGSFATLGRFDVVDLVEAEDPKQIEKAAMIIRGYGHSMTETLVATPWKEFLTTL